MPAPYTNLFVRIQAATIEVAFDVAQRAASHIGAIRGRECRAVQVGSRPLGGAGTVFCRSATGRELVASLEDIRRAASTNLVIIDDRGIDFDLEDWAVDSVTDVMLIQTYQDQDNCRHMKGHFLAASSRRISRLRTLLVLMMDERDGGHLNGRPGDHAEILIDPTIMQPTEIRHSLDVLVGFSSWTRRRAIEVLGEILPAYLYTTHPDAVAPDGPIPLAIQISENRINWGR